MANASRGRPTGHKTKRFGDALMLELKLATEDKSELRVIARKLVSSAKKGESWAIREIADRLDGKAHQSTDTEHSFADPLMEVIDWVSENGKRAFNR